MDEVLPEKSRSSSQFVRCCLVAATDERGATCPQAPPLSDRAGHSCSLALPKPTYFGLPSILADSLPDDFGNALIDAWMATKGIEKSAITILDRLAYTGKRGMGA